MRRWKYEEVTKTKRKRVSCSSEVEVDESPRKIRKQPGSLHWRAQAARASREQNEKTVMHQEIKTRSESNLSSKFQNIKTMFENLSKPKEIQAKSFGNPVTNSKSPEKSQVPNLSVERFNQTGENQKGSSKIKLPQQHPPFDRGRNDQYKAHPSTHKQRNLSLRKSTRPEQSPQSNCRHIMNLSQFLNTSTKLYRQPK